MGGQHGRGLWCVPCGVYLVARKSNREGVNKMYEHMTCCVVPRSGWVLWYRLA